MKNPGPHVCPNCGERVSAFAAGCAICGADLDPRRASGPPTLKQRASRRWEFTRRWLEQRRRRD